MLDFLTKTKVSRFEWTIHHEAIDLFKSIKTPEVIFNVYKMSPWPTLVNLAKNPNVKKITLVPFLNQPDYIYIKNSKKEFLDALQCNKTLDYFHIKYDSGSMRLKDCGKVVEKYYKGINHQINDILSKNKQLRHKNYDFNFFISK